MSLLNKAEVTKVIRKLNNNKKIDPQWFDKLIREHEAAGQRLWELEEAMRGNILKVPTSRQAQWEAVQKEDFLEKFAK